MSLIKPLFSFETFFVLWLFSYQYKNAWGVFTSPDITLLLTFILVPWGIILYVQNKPERQTKFSDAPNLAFLAISLWFIASSFWSASHMYKLQKTLCYAIYTLPAFLVGYLVISQDKMRVKRLLGAFFVFSLVVLAECFRIFKAQGLTSFPDILNTNYLVTGQTLGVGLLVLLAWSFFQFTTQHKSYSWVLSLSLSSLFVYALLNLGGRGPLMASMGALALFYGVNGFRYPLKKVLIHLSIFLLFCGVSYGLLNGFFGHTGSHFAQRLAPVLLGQEDASLNERFSYYQTALNAFFQHPLIGVGLGGWPVFHGLGDIALHPHNIFLEILAETGVIGFILFAFFLFFSLKRLTLAFFYSNWMHASILLIPLFASLNALKTGDLHDNLLLFVSLSLCGGLSPSRPGSGHDRWRQPERQPHPPKQRHNPEATVAP